MTDRRFGRILLYLLVCLWLVALSLAARVNHDESQYLAGALLSDRLLLFRDFAYLQPPLHAWANAPLGPLFPGHGLIAMRVVNALTAAGTLWLTLRAMRCIGVSGIGAMIAVLLMLATEAFAFCAGVIRNDMLPAALEAAAIWAALWALRQDRVHGWALSGLLFGLAVSAKISFALPAAAAVAFLLTNAHPLRWRSSRSMSRRAALVCCPWCWTRSRHPEISSMA